jgi:hypothetical protein
VEEEKERHLLQRERWELEAEAMVDPGEVLGESADTLGEDRLVGRIVRILFGFFRHARSPLLAGALLAG